MRPLRRLVRAHLGPFSASRVWGSILMDEHPLPIDKKGLDIVIRVRALITRRSVSDLQVDGVFVRTIQ